MINSLPQISENELLYSVIARYRRMCGMVSKRALIEDLFGKFVVMQSTYFPQYINAFIGNLPPTSKITADKVISEHTLFPFYTAFLSPQKTQQIYELMKNGGGGSRSSIEMLIGFGGSKVRKSNYLKYCPLCFENDLEILGESYWRTNHQIVGSLYCLEHQVLLKESSVPSTGSGIEFICADSQVCDKGIIEDNFTNETKQLNLQYINNAEQLMKGNISRKELTYIIDFYIDRLREKGLASKNGSLYMQDVQEQFLDYYPEQYLHLMQSDINPESPSNWIRLFVRNNNKNRSPLRHLLFMQFLNIKPFDLFLSRKVIGKKVISVKREPIFNLNERRGKWLAIVEKNPGASRSELKEIGKGLHTWIFAHDREWYEEVTPRNKPRKRSDDFIDWEQRDVECLVLARNAVETILQKEEKPIRITPTSIRNALGFGRWFTNEKLKSTNVFLREVKEDINHFRIRKIKWAIDEMISKGESLTPYKIQLYAGFGGSNKEVRKLILQTLNKDK